MYSYRISDTKNNSSRIVVGMDFLQGLYSMYTLASLYFMKPDDNAKVLNEIIDNFTSVSVIRTDVIDTSMPTIYKNAYDVALYRPSDFLHCRNSLNDEALLPYHIVPNFDSYYVPDIIREQSNEDIFIKCCDDESCRYYLGISSSAKNTFMIKVISWSNNIKEFLTGFGAGLRWYSQCLKQSLPNIYLYDYEKPVCLIPSYSGETMEKQLPRTITKVELSN